MTMMHSAGNVACECAQWICVLGTLSAPWLRCISRSSQMLSVICHRGSGRIIVGESEINLGRMQHPTTVFSQRHAKWLKKEQTSGNYVWCGCFIKWEWKGGEFFVLAIKIKCNDFSHKNSFSADAVKSRSETLLESPIKTHLFDV